MSAKNKLEKVFGKIEESGWENAAREWKNDLNWLDYAQQIALEVLELLSQKGLSQKAFAEKMQVSPQVVSKWLKGKENFTLETIVKMEAVLGKRLIKIGEPATNDASFFEEVIISTDTYLPLAVTTRKIHTFLNAPTFEMLMPYEPLMN